MIILLKDEMFNTLIVIHTTYNTGTSTYKIYDSNTTTPVPYITNDICYTIQ